MMPSIWEQLAVDFPPDAVKRRLGPKSRDKTQALVLHYIDARDVMDRLDAVVGPEGWQDRYRVIGDDGAVECRLSIAGLTKADVGYPNADDDPEPLKGAYSDALKRAGVKFGIGRSLYALPQEWAPIDDAGRFTGHESAAPRPRANRAQGRVPGWRGYGLGPPDDADYGGPPPPDDADYGDRDVFTPVGASPAADLPYEEPSGEPLLNRWGDPIPGPCPKHGPGDVKPQKKSGEPYLDQDKNPVARCRKVLNKGKIPWEGGECWFAIPIA